MLPSAPTMARNATLGVVLTCVGPRHTFNYDLVNGPHPTAQVPSIWRIPTVPRREKLHGHHPTQKPLRLVRRALLASTGEGALVLDPFTGSGTTAVAAKELGRFWEYHDLLYQSQMGGVLRELAEHAGSE